MSTLPSSLWFSRWWMWSMCRFVTQVIIVDKSDVFRENLRERLIQKGFHNINVFEAFDAAPLKELMESSITTKSLLFCELDDNHNQDLLELQAKTAPAFTCVLMGKSRPQEGVKENYFIRKPIKEEALKNLILDLVNIWGSRSTKRRHSVSDIPSSRFIRPAMRQPSLPSLEEEPPPLKILVAEDNLMNQKVMMRSLKSMGHLDIRIATDGKQTLDALEVGMPDLILMDVQMPIYDGVTCTKKIREKYGPWPFIASMTANTFPEDKEKCLSAGMNAFLTKPLRIDQLKGVVQECQMAKRSMLYGSTNNSNNNNNINNNNNNKNNMLARRQIARTNSDTTAFQNTVNKHSNLTHTRSYDAFKYFKKNHNNNTDNTNPLENTTQLRNSMDFYRKLRTNTNLDSYKMTTTGPSPTGSTHTSDNESENENFENSDNYDNISNDNYSNGSNDNNNDLNDNDNDPNDTFNNDSVERARHNDNMSV